jgi:hypothetical protein
LCGLANEQRAGGLCNLLFEENHCNYFEAFTYRSKTCLEEVKPDQTLKKINKMLFNFIWGTTREVTKRELLYKK